jgi:hypothetical protein
MANLYIKCQENQPVYRLWSKKGPLRSEKQYTR